MTSRSEISASRPTLWPLSLPARHFVTVSGREWDLVPRGTRNVCDVYRSILGKVVSPSLSLLFLVVVPVCMSSCDVRPLLGHTICQNLCVCVFSKHFRWAGCSSFAWRLSAFHSVLSTLYWFTNMFFMAFWCWRCRPPNPSSFLFVVVVVSL